MTQLEVFEEQAFARGSRTSIVQEFQIAGLYGYRTVSLSSPYAATVLIAQNGSGKTTLLAALDAFLRGQLTRLIDLDFEIIRCRLAGVLDILVLSKSDLQEFSETLPETEIARWARRLELSTQAVLRFLVDDYPNGKGDYSFLSEDPVFSAFLKNTSYDLKKAYEICDKLVAGMFSHIPALQELVEVLRGRLADVEIVYLPTYRRIEMPLLTEKQGASSRRRRPRFRGAPGSIFGGDIQFGLSDISEKLADLNQQILVESNLGYRSISANIINELIDNTLDREDPAALGLPTKEELILFFSRLKEGGRQGPYRTDVSVPEIDKIYSGSDDITFANNKFLRYFLSKLATVIVATKDIEIQVTKFIDSCNKYLSPVVHDGLNSNDRLRPDQTYYDRKTLQLDRRNLRVYAESVVSGREISLDSLSSGEKQMVSLFAKLFLYPHEKIVLFDEPELSLSIEWQRRILPDVILAPSCSQIIAITHSPFIFDNALEPFAKPLELHIDLNAPVPELYNAGFEGDA